MDQAIVAGGVITADLVAGAAAALAALGATGIRDWPWEDGDGRMVTWDDPRQATGEGPYLVLGGSDTEEPGVMLVVIRPAGAPEDLQQPLATWGELATHLAAEGCAPGR